MKNEKLDMIVRTEDGELMKIDLSEVDFIETDKKRRIIYNIGKDRYFHIRNKTDLDNILFDHGFDMLDKPFLVNLKKIKKFDEGFGKVYFTENPTSTSPHVTVAKIKYKFVSHILKRCVANNNDKTIEHKINKKTVASSLKEMFHR